MICRWFLGPVFTGKGFVSMRDFLQGTAEPAAAPQVEGGEEADFDMSEAGAMDMDTGLEQQQDHEVLWKRALDEKNTMAAAMKAMTAKMDELRRHAATVKAEAATEKAAAAAAIDELRQRAAAEKEATAAKLEASTLLNKSLAEEKAQTAVKMESMAAEISALKTRALAMDAQNSTLRQEKESLVEQQSALRQELEQLVVRACEGVKSELLQQLKKQPC